jgi:DNA-binding transcriptional LysR family regulator
VDLRALRVVVAIAEHGSVTRAAESLQQSNSAISHTLLGLESELEVNLFHRLPHGMALTEAGKDFVVAARRALHEAEVARRSIDAIRGVFEGRLSIASVRGLDIALADVVGEFSRRHPGVVVWVFPDQTTEGVKELVRSGRCDVGFTWSATVEAASRRVAASFPEPTPSDLQSVPVFEDPSIVLVPEDHPLAARQSLRIVDLQGQRMVTPLESSIMQPVFSSGLRPWGVELNVVAQAATNEMLLELVRAGVGCTLTLASSAAPIVGRGAVALELVDHLVNVFLMVTRSRQDPTPAARVFCELAVQHFASRAESIRNTCNGDSKIREPDAGERASKKPLRRPSTRGST